MHCDDYTVLSEGTGSLVSLNIRNDESIFYSMKDILTEYSTLDRKSLLAAKAQLQTDPSSLVDLYTELSSIHQRLILTSILLLSPHYIEHYHDIFDEFLQRDFEEEDPILTFLYHSCQLYVSKRHLPLDFSLLHSHAELSSCAGSITALIEKLSPAPLPMRVISEHSNGSELIALCFNEE
ncbi:hypothetical protein P9112_000436 [Eukaryota sp. TZLM1-RC]